MDLIGGRDANLASYITQAPNAQQMSALPVAMVKSSVPRGESNSRAVLDIDTVTARAMNAAGKPLSNTMATLNTSPPTRPVTVPPTDLRFTSPMPRTGIFCAPYSEPPTSASVSTTR